MACHFISALNIPSLQNVKRKLHVGAAEDNVTNDDAEGENNDTNNNNYFDIDTSMDVEASEHDTAVIEAASTTSFKPGDVVGKIMAFIAQLRLSSEDTREYLKKICLARGCPPLEVKIWVRGRWGSLSDCFRVILSQQKVCLSPSPSIGRC